MSEESAPKAPPPAEPGQHPSAETLLPWGNRSDWIELAATILLSLATIAATWAAYQATRWGGVQTNAYSTSSAKRTAATQQNNIFTSQAQIDVMTWITYLEHYQAGDERGAGFLMDRFRKEFRPAFDAWLAQVPRGEYPPGTPFDLPEYRPEARRLADELNAEADEFTATAREANQIGDNFVLVAVVMASVLFFAGVGTKLKARGIRLFMLGMGFALFAGGVSFMLSMPQNIGF